MSEAPERIWIGPDQPGEGWGEMTVGSSVVWESSRMSAPDDRSGLVEYIRADPLWGEKVRDVANAMQDLLAAYSEPDRQLCCNGHHCGCYGASVRDQAEHNARAAIAAIKGE